MTCAELSALLERFGHPRRYGDCSAPIFESLETRSLAARYNLRHRLFVCAAGHDHYVVGPVAPMPQRRSITVPGRVCKVCGFKLLARSKHVRVCSVCRRHACKACRAVQGHFRNCRSKAARRMRERSA